MLIIWKRLFLVLGVSDGTFTFIVFSIEINW